MKREDEIDKIFKQGIPASSFENLPAGRQGKDALWQRIEKDLDKQPRKKRPLVYLAVLLCLLTGGIFLLNNNGNEKQLATAPKKIQPQKETIQKETTISSAENIVSKKAEDKNQDAEIILEKKTSVGLMKTTSSIAGLKASVAIDMPAVSEENDYSNEAVKKENLLEEISYEPTLISTAQKHNSVKIKNINAPPILKYNDRIKQKKYSIDVVGGVSIASFNKSAGFYAGIAVNKSLKNDAAVSAALLYSASNLSQKYMLSGKPDYNKETDAILNKLNMLQLNLQLRQRVKGTPLFLSAGLMPVYVLDASFVNLPSTDSSNPSLYRRFTLKDINRLNVLFAAGARYGLTKKVHAEITGTYGLTGLVKDSYINQSNLKGNFRSVQVGLVWSLE